jgi:hypothetical protein
LPELVPNGMIFMIRRIEYETNGINETDKKIQAINVLKTPNHITQG